MSEPYDGAATSFVALIQQLQAGSISAYDAALALAPILATFSPDDTTQFGEVIKVLGRVDGMLLVDGPPANTLGTVGATAIDLDAQLFYPPKTEAGWTAPAVPFVGGQGPAGQISSATVTLIDASLPASIVLGGTAENRTMEFRLPNPTQAAVSLFDIMARSSLYGISSDLGLAAKFASAGLEMNFLTGYYRQGINLRGALANVVGWSFTRASTGTARNAAGVISSFASSVPRITDLGLLVETASNNLLLQSSMGVSPWNATGVTRTASAGTAPDGTNTATRIESVGTGGSLFIQSRVATGTTGVYSFFIKKGSGATQANRILVYNSTTGVSLGRGTINLDTGAITWNITTHLGSLAPTQAEAYADGWWRVHAPIVGGITAGNTITYYVAFDSSAPPSPEWALAWGGQWEETARQTPTSYMPTTTAGASRASDLVYVNNTLSGTAGTLRVQFRRGWKTGATEGVVGDGVSSPLLYITSDTGYSFIPPNNLSAGTAPLQNVVGRGVVSWSSVDPRRLDYNTSASAQGVAGGPASAQLQLGGYAAGSILNGYVQSVVHIPQYTSLAQVEAMAA
jgi:hypothetical protein